MELPGELIDLCRKHLGETPERIEPFTTGPQGARRGTCRVRVGETSVYATQRKSSVVATKEAEVLRALSAGGAPVPRFIAFESGWLLQESAGAQRLAEHLDQAAGKRVNELIDRALATLAEVQAVGAAANLHEVIVPFARGVGTGEALLQGLERIGEQLKLPAPQLSSTQREACIAFFVEPGDAFIKWDSRPGNAALDAHGSLAWFDWQHANLRHPADDRVWLLCDEAVPESASPVERLVESAEDWGASQDYVCVLGVLHAATRIGAVLQGSAGLSASWEECLRNDWCGSLESARRLARRAQNLASHSSITEVLVEWFAELDVALSASD